MVIPYCIVRGNLPLPPIPPPASSLSIVVSEEKPQCCVSGFRIRNPDEVLSPGLGGLNVSLQISVLPSQVQFSIILLPRPRGKAAGFRELELCEGGAKAWGTGSEEF